MTKKQLRQKYRNLRAGLSQEELDIKSLEIANTALQCEIWDFNFYHIFLPIERLREINTEYLLSILSGKDKNILLSKSNFDRGSMQHYLLTDSTKIVLNAYDIPEPKDGIELPPDKVEVVFIPLLGYDKKGNRVGYGKGFYDRFLASCDSAVIKVGLSLFEPENEIIEDKPHDIRLDYCVTPNKVYTFKPFVTEGN